MLAQQHPPEFHEGLLERVLNHRVDIEGCEELYHSSFFDAAKAAAAAVSEAAEVRTLATVSAKLPPLPLLQLELLPPSFTDFHAGLIARRDFFEAGAGDTMQVAQCLVCGKRLVLATRGVCCAHIEKCSANSGGAVLIVQLGCVIIFRRALAAQVPSPYVDQYGEDGLGKMRGRLLHLDEARLEHLRNMWAEGRLGSQAVRLRDNARRVIISGYY
tara:strand:- start:272 stop:916 length:645 start_codon:yes stop_codon:yes gene_type:complete